MKNALEELLKTPLVACCLFIFFFSCNTPGEKAAAKVHTVVIQQMKTVVIQQMKFTPADLTVNEGDTVTWINRDIVAHNITEEANKEWSSSSLPPGKSWSMVAKKSAGYFCSIHPVMKGSLHVK